jgi:hypothetical protein
MAPNDPRARRARRAAPPRGALLLALLLAPAAPAAAAPPTPAYAPEGGLDPLAAESFLFYSTAPAMALTTPAWSIVMPLQLAATLDPSTARGIFINGTSIFTFRVPSLLKVWGGGAATGAAQGAGRGPRCPHACMAGAGPAGTAAGMQVSRLATCMGGAHSAGARAGMSPPLHVALGASAPAHFIQPRPPHRAQAPDLARGGWIRLRGVRLLPASPSATGPVLGSTVQPRSLRLTLKLPKGAAAVDWAGKRQNSLQKDPPYSVQFGRSTKGTLFTSNVAAKPPTIKDLLTQKTAQLPGLAPGQYALHVLTAGSLAIGGARMRGQLGSAARGFHPRCLRDGAPWLQQCFPLMSRLPRPLPPHPTQQPQCVPTATAAPSSCPSRPPAAALSAPRAARAPASASAARAPPAGPTAPPRFPPSPAPPRAPPAPATSPPTPTAPRAGAASAPLPPSPSRPLSAPSP